MRRFFQLLRASRAATAIEYGLIAAMQRLGNQCKRTFGNVAPNMKTS